MSRRSEHAREAGRLDRVDGQAEEHPSMPETDYGHKLWDRRVQLLLLVQLHRQAEEAYPHGGR